MYVQEILNQEQTSSNKSDQMVGYNLPQVALYLPFQATGSQEQCLAD